MTETERINKYLAEREKLNELNNEKKKSIIQNALWIFFFAALGLASGSLKGVFAIAIGYAIIKFFWFNDQFFEQDRLLRRKFNVPDIV